MSDIKMITTVLITKSSTNNQALYYSANLDTFETATSEIKTIMPNIYSLVDGDLRDRAVVKKDSHEYNELTSVIVNYMAMLKGFNDVL